MSKLSGIPLTDTRFADVTPSSYDAKARTVEAVLSMGSPVTRFYGTEVLRIHPDAVDLNRMKSSGIMLLDSHQQTGLNNALGRVQRTWFNRGALLGRLIFNDTKEGRKAEGMVARGEIAGISAGYSVKTWEVTDAKGNVIDPEKQRINFDDVLTFTATRWEPHEFSLVSCPADAGSAIRSFGSNVDRQLPFVDMLERRAIEITKRGPGGTSITYKLAADGSRQIADFNVGDVRARMLARQRMQGRML
jgi:phage head maturation protease